MHRSNAITATRKSFRSKVANVGAVVGLAMFSAAASAGELASAFTTEATTAKAELMLIGAAVLGVCAVIFLINSGKRTAK